MALVTQIQALHKSLDTDWLPHHQGLSQPKFLDAHWSFETCDHLIIKNELIIIPGHLEITMHLLCQNPKLSSNLYSFVVIHIQLHLR